MVHSEKHKILQMLQQAVRPSLCMYYLGEAITIHAPLIEGSPQVRAVPKQRMIQIQFINIPSQPLRNLDWADLFILYCYAFLQEIEFLRVYIKTSHIWVNM